MPPGPKPGSASRRVSSSLSKVSTPPATATTTTPTRTPKSSRQTKIVRLKLSKDQLQRFPHEQQIRKAGQVKASPLSTSTVITPDDPIASSTVKPEPDATPDPKGKQGSPSPIIDVKSDSLPAPKTGSKRELGAGVEGDDKDKVKNAPRKRAKPDPGKVDGRTAAGKAMKGALGTAAGVSHKLGPKANQGIINAGLRALDRTGKPCRKWDKTGFRIKSFTGRVWEISSWRSGSGRAFGSEKEQGKSNSQSKENSSSNLGSDKSPAVNPSHQASSPVNGIGTPL